jgi:hypothetical protein
MSDDHPPFYSPNRPPPAPRQPKPGEEVCRLQHNRRVQSCELRNDSKAGAGWECAGRQEPSWLQPSNSNTFAVAL